MPDFYLYDDVPVLRNKFGIKDDKVLDLIEAEQSRANMMLLYEQGFNDFSPRGICAIHKFLFGDIYEWAGEYRLINIEKRERLLGGRSVWYSNDERISDDLKAAFHAIERENWTSYSRAEFVSALARNFPMIWKVHPFREGNTRTVVMLITFFVEHHGYYTDQELLAQNAGYVRDSFMMACIDRYSEYEHLEKILMDAVLEEPMIYNTNTINVASADTAHKQKHMRYQKYKYTPEPHTKRED